MKVTYRILCSSDCERVDKAVSRYCGCCYCSESKGFGKHGGEERRMDVYKE